MIRSFLVITLTILIHTTVVFADSVTDWHAFAVKTVGDRGSRTFAILQAAVFDTVNGITPKYHFYKVFTDVPDANIDAAVAAASSRVLLELAPEKKTEINAMYTKTMASVPDSPQKEAGITHGHHVANELLKLRNDDGYNRFVSYDDPPTTGVFHLPEGKSATGIQLSYTKPFVLQSTSQFRLAPPYPLTSQEYAKDIDEVRTLGSIDSKTRTKDQTDSVFFWDTNIIMTWNMVANYEARHSGKSEIDNAHSLALFDLAVFDALIAIFETKYYYKLWRPEEAIHRASEISNAHFKPDPQWTPILKQSSSPEYASAHSAIAGAASYILIHIYGNKGPITITTEADSKGTRTFKSIKDAAIESSLSRLYAGNHSRTSTDKGFKLGEDVSQYVLKTVLLPLEGQ